MPSSDKSKFQTLSVHDAAACAGLVRDDLYGREWSARAVGRSELLKSPLVSGGGPTGQGSCGGVHSRTSKAVQSRYASTVQPEHLKAAIFAGRVCAVCAVALFGQIIFSAWALFVALAVLPPLAGMRYWRAPVQIGSHSIQEVLR